MAKQTIGIGSTANDGTGDPLRTAFDKANDNFDELYAKSVSQAGSILRVEDFIEDADGDDIGIAFNRACRAAESIDSKAKAISLDRGSYTLDTTIDLPSSTIGASPRFIDIDIRGCVFSADNAGTAFRRVPSSQSNAMQIITKLVPIFFGGEVQNAADFGWDIGSTYSARFVNCHASVCGVGFRLAFGLSGYFDNCFATACVDKSFSIVTGFDIWSGATTSNSASNVTKLFKCRSWMSTYTGTQFHINNSDSVLLEGCISEGSACKYEVDLKQDNTVALSFYVKNHHLECGNTDTCFRLNGKLTVSIDGVDRGAISSRLFNFIGISQYSISNFPYINSPSRAWTAKSYSEGSRAALNGNLYTAIADVTADDIPGTSESWEDIGADKSFLGTMTGSKSLVVKTSNNMFSNFDNWETRPVNFAQELFLGWSAGFVIYSPNSIRVMSEKELMLSNNEPPILNTNPGYGASNIRMIERNNTIIQRSNGDTETVSTTPFIPPTSDPGVVGALWNNDGVLTISSG